MLPQSLRFGLKGVEAGADTISPIYMIITLLELSEFVKLGSECQFKKTQKVDIRKYFI